MHFSHLRQSLKEDIHDRNVKISEAVDCTRKIVYGEITQADGMRVRLLSEKTAETKLIFYAQKLFVIHACLDNNKNNKITLPWITICIAIGSTYK